MSISYSGKAVWAEELVPAVSDTIEIAREWVDHRLYITIPFNQASL